MINISKLESEIKAENNVLRTRTTTHTCHRAVSMDTAILAEIGLAIYERLGDMMMLQVNT
jgi:hypothetical protein